MCPAARILFGPPAEIANAVRAAATELGLPIRSAVRAPSIGQNRPRK